MAGDYRLDVRSGTRGVSGGQGPGRGLFTELRKWLWSSLVSVGLSHKTEIIAVNFLPVLVGQKTKAKMLAMFVPPGGAGGGPALFFLLGVSPVKTLKSAFFFLLFIAS